MAQIRRSIERISCYAFERNLDVVFVCDAACTSDQFQCEYNGFCIPDEFVCDGDNDCGDYSDEYNCEHGKCHSFHCDKQSVVYMDLRQHTRR